jgi:hypothetical protein
MRLGALSLLLAAVIGCARPTSTAKSPERNAPEGAARPDQAKLSASATFVCALFHGRLACADRIHLASERGSDPVLVDVPGDWLDVAVSFAHMCAVRSDGHVQCRGGNQYGELGAGIAKERSEDFVEVRGVSRAVRIAVGEFVSCALLDDGAVTCWGNAADGETQAKDAYIPELRALVEVSRVPLPRPMEGIAIGSAVCAYDAAGAFCWGAGHDVHPVDGPAKITSMSAAPAGYVYVTTAATAFALPAPVSPAIPREIPLLAGASGLTSNGQVLCGTTAGGALRCDGDRRSLEDDPRRGPMVRAWERVGPIAAFALLDRSAWALTPTGDLWVSGVVFDDWRYEVPQKIGNLARGRPPG